MVMAAAPIFLAGSFYEPFQAVGAIYVLILGAFMLLDALMLPRRSRIRIERIVPQRISLSVPARIAFNVFNGAQRRAEIRLAEDLPEGFTALPCECAGTFGPGAEGTLEYRLTARRRGRYALSALDVRVLPAFGLFARQFRLNLPSPLDVYPNLVNTRRYELQLRRGLQSDQGVARMRQIGQGTEFESLRHYSAGDGMARVDWKATARRSTLIVRNYEPERHQSLLVAIDVGRATAGEFLGISRLDYFINAAVMLAYAALRQGDWFSLVAFSDRIESYLPPVRRLQSMERVARALYELEPRLVEADYGAACRFMGLKQRKRSLICLMTDVIDREASSVIIAYMARFARVHLPLAVTLADPEVREIAREPLSTCADVFSKAVALDALDAREEALMRMRAMGVSVLEANPGDLITEVLRRYLQIKAGRRL